MIGCADERSAGCEAGRMSARADRGLTRMTGSLALVAVPGRVSIVLCSMVIISCTLDRLMGRRIYDTRGSAPPAAAAVASAGSSVGCHFEIKLLPR